jgi:hypothetical protein
VDYRVESSNYKLSSLFDFNSILDDRGENVMRRSLHDCDVKYGFGIIRQGETHCVEVLESVGSILTGLALDCD